MIESGHLAEPRGQSEFSVARSRIERAIPPASGKFPLVLRTAGLAFVCQSVNHSPFVLVILAILCSETALDNLISG